MMMVVVVVVVVREDDHDKLKYLKGKAVPVHVKICPACSQSFQTIGT
jgi:hypothetical protein